MNRREEKLMLPETPSLVSSGIKRSLCTPNYKHQHFTASVLKHEALSSPARKRREVNGLVTPSLSFVRAVKHIDIYNNPLNLHSNFCAFKDLNYALQSPEHRLNLLFKE